MQAPSAPVVGRLTRLSYSQYESGRSCLARLAWTAVADRSAIPDRSGAILGGAFHGVIEHAHRGAFAGQTDLRAAARTAFDDDVQTRWLRAHALLRLKFPTATQLPFYNIRREQCAAIAETAARGRSSASRTPSAGQQPGGSEQWLASQDQLLFGRADYLERSSRAVIDYKSGFIRPLEGAAIAESEKRQLRFYGHLALENGVAVERGVIVRGSGAAPELRFTPAEAQVEGDAARDVLDRYNAAIAGGATFDALAAPSMSACAFCDCIPFCDRFWSTAEPSWREACGTHAEGVVRGVSVINSMGARIVQLRLTRTRGTVERGDLTIEQVPADWLEVGGGSIPAVGETVRAVDCRAVEHRPGVLRADKTSTAVWSL